MDALLSDRDRARRLGAAARRRVEDRFSARTQARRHAALFHHDPALAGREVA
jgi:hypothetical protein